MGKRNTPAKQKILDLFLNSQSALCSSMIEEELEGSVDRSTVYRIIRGFEKEGKIHKVVDSKGKIFYAACNMCSSSHHHHNHLHFKCTKCETVECLDMSISFPKKEGYEFHNFYGLINGICATCH